MSNVIDFLEALGSNAQLHRAGAVDIQSAMEAAAIGPELRAAILDADQTRLEILLGAQTNVCCMVHAPEPDDDDEQSDEPDPDEEKEDPKEQRS